MKVEKRPGPSRRGLMMILAVGLMLSLSTAPAAAQRPETGTTLAQGAGYALTEGSAKVHSLQLRLQALGERPGPADGRFGPRTEAAVRRLQTRARISADGIVGRETSAALRRTRPRALQPGSGLNAADGSNRVRRLQRQLRRRGHSPGPVDGKFGPRTEAAVQRLQAARGLPTNGVAGVRTLAALYGSSQAGQASQAVPASEPERSSPGEGRPTQFAAEPREARVAPVDDGVLPDVPVVGALILLALAALGLVARRLWSEYDVRVTRIEHPLPVAGHSENGRIGRFEGLAHAIESPIESEPEQNGSAVAAGRPVLGYVCVPSSEAEGEADIETQVVEIEAQCNRLGLQLTDVIRDVDTPTGSSVERPGLAYAVERLRAGEALALVVAELVRLGRSSTDLSEVLAWLEESEVRVIVVEPDLDSFTESGRVALRALKAVGDWERRRLQERTRKGMEAARERGEAISRPAVKDIPELREHILEMHERGMTLQEIADRLNEEGVPTVRGGRKWRPSSVQGTVGYERRRPQRSLVNLQHDT